MVASEAALAAFLKAAAEGLAGYATSGEAQGRHFFLRRFEDTWGPDNDDWVVNYEFPLRGSGDYQESGHGPGSRQDEYDRVLQWNVVWATGEAAERISQVVAGERERDDIRADFELSPAKATFSVDALFSQALTQILDWWSDEPDHPAAREVLSRLARARRRGDMKALVEVLGSVGCGLAVVPVTDSQHD